MTGDSIAITVAAFLFACWLVAWVLLATRRAPEPSQPPEEADEPEADEGDYYYWVTREKVTTGAFARR